MLADEGVEVENKGPHRRVFAIGDRKYILAPGDKARVESYVTTMKSGSGKTLLEDMAGPDVVPVKPKAPKAA